MAYRSRLLSDEQIQTGAKFYRAGLTLPELAAVYGCSSNTVRNALLAVGVKMHPRKQPRILLTAWGETKSISEWAKDPRCAVSSAETLRQRVAAGWHPQRAIGQRPTEINGAPRKPRPWEC